MPEGVQVAITSLDLTSPGFTSATRNAQAFQASMERSNYSMREATASARLFNEELGTHMSRHLSSILSSSALIGPALQMALPIAAAIGFYEVVAKIADKFWDWYKGIEALKQFQERVDAASKNLVGLMEATDRINQQTAGVGASAQQKWATELEAATAKVVKQNASVADLSNTIYKLKQGQAEALGGGISIKGNTAEDIPDLQRIYATQVAELAKSEAERAHAQAELKIAQSAGMSEYSRQMEEAIRKSQALQREINKWALMWDKAREHARDALLAAPGQGLLDKAQIPGDFTAPDWMAQLSRAQTQPLYSGATAGLDLVKIQTDQNEAIKAAQQIYADTATKADVYSQQIQVLTELLDQGRISQQQFSKAAMDAASQLDNHSKQWKKFGDEVEKQIANAGFMKESWHKALQTILEDLAMMILKLYVLGPLMKSLGTGGGGGWLSKLLGGIFGGGGGGGGSNAGDIGFFASGGYVAPGKWGIAGENGPEPIFGGSTGMSVLSNGAMRGGVHNHYYDLRGADVGVEQRLLRLFPIVEERAVQRAVATSQERSLRR